MIGLFSHLVGLAEQSRRNERCPQNRLGARECSLQQSSNELSIEFNKSARANRPHLLPAKLQWVLSDMTFGVCTTIAFRNID